jgi:hypothetical protein
MFLVLLESPQWVGFYGDKFLDFKHEMQKILNFESLSLKIQ